MHVHDYRPRVLAGDPAGSTEISRFRCADRSCGTVVQVLPAWVARHLWRAWSTVEAAVMREQEEEDAVTNKPSSDVPARTRRRWRARLSTAAFLLIAALAAVSDTMPALAHVVGSVGHDGTRRAAVVAFGAATKPPMGRWLASLAAVVHRVAPGARLM